MTSQIAAVKTAKTATIVRLTTTVSGPRFDRAERFRRVLPFCRSRVPRPPRFEPRADSLPPARPRPQLENWNRGENKGGWNQHGWNDNGWDHDCKQAKTGSCSEYHRKWFDPVQGKDNWYECSKKCVSFHAARVCRLLYH